MTSDDLLRLAGLKPEMREAAREAARRQGMSLDAWLQSIVQSAAGEQESVSRNAKRPRRARATRTSEAEQSMRAISARLEALTDKIADLSHETAHRAPAVSEDDSLSATLRAIEQRIDSLGPSSPPTSPAGYAAMPPRSRGTVREDWPLDDIDTDDLDFHRGHAATDNDLERQIAEIAARQQALEDQNEPLQDQFLALSRRLDQAPRKETRDLHDQMIELTQELQAVRGGGGFETAVNSLRRDLAEINRKLSDAAPRQAVQAIEAEVRALATRIDEGRHAGGDPQALASIEAGLAQVYDALRHMAPAEQLTAFRDEIRKLDDKIESLAAREPDANTTSAVLRQLERAIIDLGTIASRAASGDALVALAEEVQDISARTDRILADSGTREDAFSSMIEQRFSDLARHLDGRQQSSIATAQTQINSVVNALAAKLERADLGGGESSTLNAIAGQLNHITQRLEHSDARINQFADIERSFTDLVGRMDAIHAGAVSAAQDVARHGPSHGELDALRRDLGALQQSHVQSDERTQQTLSSVHQTLEKLVDRLELGAAQPAEARAPAMPYAPAERMPPPDEARWTIDPPVAPPAEPPPVRAPMAEAPPISHQRAPIDPTLPADFPLEPGTTARDVSAAPAAPAGESPKSNFIAAARRAAQAAMQATEPGPPTEGGGSTLSAIARKFSRRNTMMLAVLLAASLGALYLAFDNPPARPLSDVKKVAVTSIKPPEQRAPAATSSAARNVTPAAPTAAPAAVQTTASVTPPAPSAAPASKPGEMPAVSPLTIASIQLPSANDLTATVSRATGLAPAGPSSPGAQNELPATFPAGLRSAALTGNAAAEYEIGVRFADGRGTAQNYPEAARWLERAANRNLAPAQYRLGSLYEKGNGVKKDVEQARRLYRAAADAGNGKAMHNLAVLFAEGIEGRPDFRNALEWFRKAANHGIPDSQYNVAILYARGLGTEANLAESYKWFALAAKQGDEDAGKKRDDVAGRLEAAQLQAAQQAVQTFRPAEQPEAAVTVMAPAGGWEAAAPESTPKPKTGFGRKRAQT